MRWLFYYPTWNKPSGGNKQMRLMASLLMDLGVEVYLLRDRRFLVEDPSCDDNLFYGLPIPLAPFRFEEASEHVQPTDVVILPEVSLKETLPFCGDWKCRIALNNQNGFYALGYRPNGRVANQKLEFAFANAPYVAAICKDFLGLPADRIFNVPHWVVRPPFEPRDTEETRRLSVCYMPRKLPNEVRQIRDAVIRCHPDVPWVEIDGVPEARVAQIYREHSIFFAAQDMEGCPLTALEAMACGCIVAGFGGTACFPHPYATPHNGLWVPDRKVEAAAEAVCRAIEIVRGDTLRHRQFLAAGRETAMRFSRQSVDKALVDMLTVVTTQAYASRRKSIRSLDWRGTLCAYRLLYNYNRLGWPGRIIDWLARATKPLRTRLQRDTA